MLLPSPLTEPTSSPAWGNVLLSDVVEVACLRRLTTRRFFLRPGLVVREESEERLVVEVCVDKAGLCRTEEGGYSVMGEERLDMEEKAYLVPIPPV